MKKIREALDLLSGFINYEAEKNNRDYPVRRTVLNDARAELEELKKALDGIDCAINKKIDWSDAGKLVTVREIMQQFKMMTGGE